MIQLLVSFSYGYDTLTSNLTSETRSGGSYGGTTGYVYDTLGQLVRVDDPRDTRGGTTGTTWTYGYDRGGNLSWESMYAYNPGSGATPIQTVYYAYGDSVWKDLLTAYNGVTLSWDTVGNLTGDGTWTYTWERGRQLKGMTAAGTSIAYEYNHEGLRVRKTVNNTMTEYWLSGAQITHMTHGNEWMHFYYDGQGRPAIVNYNGSTYHYLYDLQGDVIGLVDSTGTLVVEYKYDAWGKPLGKSGTLASTLGTLNPFRYRGYVYDEETGLYYLRSRYYNPEWGRFISADALLGKTGALFSHNLFAYCGNNPVICADYNGFLWLWNEFVDWVCEKVNVKNKADKQLAKEHPGIAFQGYIAKEVAYSATAALFGPEWDYDGTKANAFKHCYWNAYMTYRMGADSAKLVADAHEEGMMETAPEDTNMDLHNNQIGRELGDITGYHITKKELLILMDNYSAYKTNDWKEYILIDRVFEAFQRGDLVVLR